MKMRMVVSSPVTKYQKLRERRMNGATVFNKFRAAALSLMRERKLEIYTSDNGVQCRQSAAE